MTEFFENNLKKEGTENPIVHPFPDGEILFVLRKIKGNTQADTGCNTAIVKDGIPQTEFNTILLRSGPIDIDLAMGVKVYAN